MPNKQPRRPSVVDMLAKVPVAKGSLLVGIENLLKTIESSENGVMIPTLLRDKCDFDAWELLFVAKILKASILGHVDLVEFYMNHIGMNSAQFNAAAQGLGNPTTPTASSTATTNGGQSFGTQAASATTTPTTRPHSPAASINGLQMRAASPSLSPGGIQMRPSEQENGSQPPPPPTQEAGPHDHLLSLSGSSISSVGQNQFSARSQLSGSSVSWASASGGSQQPSTGQQPPSPGSSSSSNSSPTGSTLGSSIGLASAVDQTAAVHQEAAAPSSIGRLQRQAQPPSLLQLTTTNNHINHQLSISTSGAGSHSISNGHAAAAVLASTARQQPPTELRHSRSAGCLFRLNSTHSGASSPRTPLASTPLTPYPQAETLAKGLQLKALASDPGAPLKLLLQIEQLKQSISHVTSLLESVMELYKKSIDSIALA